MKDQIQHYQDKLSYEIDAADIAEFFKNKPTGEKMVIIDARSQDGYAAEHIPGAISFPHRTMNTETVKALDKDTLYVTYCDGIGCNASTKGALKLANLGFKTKELMGGIDWWKRDGYSTDGKVGSKRIADIQCAC